MKGLLLFIFILAISPVFSQNESDSVFYNPGIVLLKKAVTTDHYLESAFYFDNIAKTHPDQWLALYYTALSYIRASQESLVNKTKDQLLDKAQPYIDKAFSLKSGEPELDVLQAFHYQVRLLVDPKGRAINYASKADALLKKAIKADPDNPRAYFLLGNNIYYTPPMFKGGPGNALPIFLKAREKFEKYVAALPFMPEWGENENLRMIRTCSSSSKK